MSDLQDAAMNVASTLQSAHIKNKPSVVHDAAPASAAENRQIVEMKDDLDDDIEADVREDEIPVSILRPIPRRPQMPPLPDLRFEQSYFASIKDAKGWQGVAFITIRDQVLMPLIQGMAWTLIVSGWRFWNRSTQFSGQSVGAKIRRWWWGVNNWDIPTHSERGTLDDRSKAEQVGDYVTTRLSTAGVGDD